MSAEVILKEYPEGKDGPRFVIDAPEGRGENDDPREAVYMNVDLVHMDPNVQRETVQSRVDRIGTAADWDYSLAEGVTVVKRQNRHYAVEGQGRVLHQQQNHPGAEMWMVRIQSDADNYAAQEARIARRISGGRVPHSTYDKMSLERTAGDIYWQEATRALRDEFGLEMAAAANASMTAITAIAAVGWIMHSFDSVPELSAGDSVQAGSKLLLDTVAILQAAFRPKEMKDRKGMYDAIMLKVVAGSLLRHPNLDKLRLSTTLARMSVGAWQEEAKRHRPGTSALNHLGKEVLDDYTGQKRGSNRLEW